MRFAKYASVCVFVEKFLCIQDITFRVMKIRCILSSRRQRFL